MTLNEWALRWGVRPEALAELHLALGLDYDPTALPPQNLPVMSSEAAVSQAARILASRRGAALWRNNVGAGTLEDGSFLRWGLANDSASVNKVIKSGDLIGIDPVIITQEMVGQLFGRFWSVETKKPGWRFTGTERELGQQRWIGLVTKLGGRAEFWNGS